MRYLLQIDSNHLTILFLIITVCFVFILVYTFKIRKVYRNMVKIYEEKTKEIVTQKKEIENNLKKAIQNNEIMIYLQPKVNTQTEQVESAEALVRWQHPEKGFLSPKDFIPLLEKTRNHYTIG